MFNDIMLADLFALQKEETHTIVDVRSEGEYNNFTIPGSINIPVFNDEERAEVGILYKQVGKEAAKNKGLAIFSAKLPAFITSFQELNTPITLFCWRGGMRSKTAATVLNLMDIHVNRLIGGIKTYRQSVISVLDKEEFKPIIYVLNGNTGSGKTVILKHLQQKNYPVIDLENIANHRGSIFGHIGRTPHNQKKFESLLVQEIQRNKEQDYVLLEGESKRIGKVVIPEFFHEKKEQGTQIFINLPIDVRVKNILDDYQPWGDPKKFKEAFHIIKKRIHNPVAEEIESALEETDYSTVIKLLLKHYYDPRYLHASEHFQDNQMYVINARTMDEAINKVESLILKLDNDQLLKKVT